MVSSTNEICKSSRRHSKRRVFLKETENNICEQELPCKHGECIPDGDSYLCSCDSDYEGNNCETLIDDCVGRPCVNGECIDGVNSYQCRCKSGYEGTNCEENIDDCLGGACVNGDCIDGVNSYECRCKPGYEGKNCEKNIDDCLSSACVNGDCIDGVNSYECRCKPGYEGKNCEKNIDDCVGRPCVNGECIDGVNSYQCRCKPGYEGTNCGENIDDCVGNKCVHGKCVDKVNSYQCQCDFGYEGDRCDQVIMKPSTCSDANWWKSFDAKGWSNCDRDNLFITGFNRSPPKKNNKDPIYLLEEAKCCSAIPLLSSKGGECLAANWWSTLDKKNEWSLCPSGYFLNGLYRNSGDKLHKIEEGRCCKPKTHPNWYGQCYDENVGIAFDKQGWSKCSKTGHYITGVHRDSGTDWLHNIDKFRCCQMFPSVSCVTADWILSFDKQGWSKCTGENTFITGFYRSEKKGNDEIYRLEKARCCIASPQYQGESGVCVDENWWGILDNKRTWAKCRPGYFLHGLKRTSGNNVHNIEEGRCCRPKNHPAKHGHCYDQDIKSVFSSEGWDVAKWRHDQVSPTSKHKIKNDTG
ncbi:neurogenic locus Notch -like [Paramuricea clavata]|uniref:Neurogenic locus Notch -like n=1 Tax=Paramuricea clavata TaxID=317549 RepID=A0A7D9IXT8_PARCT|nr:neurogenic locus Notch -like [Paramuricea clavata]